MKINPFTSFSIKDDVARLVLHRPPLNFLNIEMLREIERHLTSLVAAPACRALIIESDISTFSCGLDLAECTRENVFMLLDQFHRVIGSLNSILRPTIALVRGIALGAGNELVCFCDFALASEKASFVQPEIKVGTVPSLAPLILPTLIGPRRALEMILTGDAVEAKEAQQIGLIHRVVPEERLEEVAQELLKTFRGLSISVMEIAIQSVRAQRTRLLDENLRQSESLILDQLMSLDDAIEGITAYLQRRAPQWKHQ